MASTVGSDLTGGNGNGWPLLGEVLAVGVDRVGGVHLPRSSQPVVQRVDAHDVLRPEVADGVAVEPDWTADPGLGRIRAFIETKTVWHPKGL